MKIAFLHAKQDSTCAKIMLRSARKHMPKAEIIQMTNMDDVPLDGVDTVLRMPWEGTVEDATKWRLRHLERIEGDVISTDTDIVFQRDVSKVFDWDFDIAIARRDGPIMTPDGKDLTKIMAFNSGIMWCRNPEVWKRCLQWLSERDDIGWYSDQMAVNVVLPEFNVLKLHADNFNYSPSKQGEDLKNRYVVHYKGKRKPWMIKDFPE